jgi:anti-sigma regulatory factor (Ser/Thr protein kinase)
LERQRLLVSLVESESRFVMRTDSSLVAPMVNHVTQSIGARVVVLGENELMRLGLALQEALLNALHHGNLELNSELREESSVKYLQLADERTKLAPYCDRQVRLNVRVDPGEITMVVEDDGAGFDISQVPDPTDPQNLLRASGRGLHLIGTIMDRVDHNECGNRITMVKRCGGGSGQSA